jgi:histidinol-phosphatase (PHP family)
MEAACRRAVEIGLPSVAFTEHVDLTPWYVPPASLDMFPRVGADYIGKDSTFCAPPVDFEGYFAEVERCRATFPSLRILTGVEFGEPHWFAADLVEMLAGGRFERVLGSLHSMQIEGTPRVVDEWFHTDRIEGKAEAATIRAYLDELTRMADADGGFEVVAHIDYLIRQIRSAGRDHVPHAFEEEYRVTLTALARSGRVLEINSRLPFDPLLVRWWHEVGGAAVSFGSDAHTPGAVGRGFADAAAVAEAAGFRPGDDPCEFWRR